jgi:hypothetical protein
MMSEHWRRCAAAALGLAGTLALCLPAFADPPARVGRLSETSGVVSFHTSDAEQWSPAILNDPVTSGDSFWTEPNARTEISIGSTELHMDSSTELDIAALDDHQFQATLPQGTINLRILRLENGDSYSIATPRGTVMIASPGTYHIDAGTDTAPTDVAVLDGAAQFVGAASSLRLTRGEAGIVSGTDPISYAIEEAQPTPFDNAVLVAERREEARPALRYVSPEMTGAEDLDDHGTWRSEPAYGAVWYPQAVPADWAPYRYGHWQWVSPWGWTWIDDQPWGFAPFHYGRWAYIGERWGWCPGTVVARPVYAPALVTFIGGAGWSLSLSVGQEPAVGWFPLAPREVYVPSYPASVNYVRNVNVTNVRNVTNITNTTINNVNVTNVNYSNRRFATVVPQSDFAASRPVAKAALTVPQTTIASAPVSRRGAPITPEAAAVTGHPAAVAAARSIADAEPHGRAQNASAPVPPTAPSQKHEAASGSAPITAPTAPTTPKSPGPPIAPAGQHRTAAAAESAPATPGAPPRPAIAPAAPAPVAAPGPPIKREASRSNGEASPPEKPAPQAPATQAKAPTAGSPGPQIAHNANEATTGQHPTTPTPPTPPLAHAPAPPAPPHVVQAPEKSAPPPQPKVASRTPAAAPPAPPKAVLPPEHPAPHPVQQTVIQPTRQGWIRAATPPPPPQAAPHPATAPQPQSAPHPGPAQHPSPSDPKKDPAKTNG